MQVYANLQDHFLCLLNPSWQVTGSLKQPREMACVLWYIRDPHCSLSYDLSLCQLPW
jgi:hypothetical protein